MWMIGDGDSSVFLSMCIGVPYGRFVQKVECTNHAIKCFHGNLEKPAKEHSNFVRRNGLTAGKIRHLTKGMKCAIQQHSTTGDSVALCKDLRNCPRHCFGAIGSAIPASARKLVKVVEVKPFYTY